MTPAAVGCFSEWGGERKRDLMSKLDLVWANHVAVCTVWCWGEECRAAHSNSTSWVHQKLGFKNAVSFH